MERRESRPPTFIPAIGRALDPAWMEHFGSAAREVLPPRFALNLRKRPGIIYVAQAQSIRIDRLGAYDNQERLARLQDYAQKTAMSLSAEGKFDGELAMDDLSMSLSEPRGLRFEHSKPNQAALALYLGDIPLSSGGEQSYQIRDEREAFLDRFHLDNTVLTSAPARHRVQLGNVSGYHPVQSIRFLKEALGEPIPLLGVGALNLAISESGPAPVHVEL